jgi:hypothetical protein
MLQVETQQCAEASGRLYKVAAASHAEDAVWAACLAVRVLLHRIGTAAASWLTAASMSSAVAGGASEMVVIRQSD